MRVSQTTAFPPADVPGWSDGLEELYAGMVEALPDGAAFVEVGVWLGKSLIFAAREAKRLGRRIRFVGVDHFRGSEEHRDLEVVRKGRLYEECRSHLERYEVNDIVTLVRSESVEAAGAFRDDSLDFVFLDAGHTYEAVQADIEAWLPKVKPGGVLAGHDWNGWPGVQMAVRDLFDAVDVLGDCWAYRKEKTLATEFLDATGTYSAARMKWQYMAVLAPADCDFREIAGRLDQLGEEGWELVVCVDKKVPIPQGGSGNGLAFLNALMHHLVFKRPKPAPAAEEAKSE